MTDRFPWHEGGWWANTIDVETGRPKEPLIKAGAINKNAGMALAAAVVATSIRDVDDALAARLNAKAELCVHRQILPKQQPDGFWHYGLSGNDPKGKDILGYFMVTTDALLKLRHFAPIARETDVDAALTRAFAFARREIAPMTAPNSGPASPRTTRGTPSHFALADNPKRGLTLGLILVAGGYHREAMKIIDHWTPKFPVGDRGQDGAKSADSFAHILTLLAAPAASNASPPR